MILLRVTGSYSRDVEHANGALTNKFDAQKLQNQIRASQFGMQLASEVMGRVLSKLYSHGVQGFDEHSATNNWGCAILEAGGSAAVAAVTGGMLPPRLLQQDQPSSSIIRLW